MKFVYPTEIPASVEDDFKHLKGASNRTGFYPIGRMNTWHGGIHIEGDKKIKAIADGIVLAYRVPKVYFEETIDNKISRYSNGFVLIQHNYESPNGQKMTFYSLYNHLASYEELKAGKIPDLFKGQAYKVKNTAKDSKEVKGTTIKSTRGTGGSVLAYAAKGTILTFLEDANDNSRRKVKYTTPNGKEIIGYTWVKKLDDEQLVNNETGEVLTERFSGSNGDLGANLRKEGNSSSEVKQLISRGTTVHVADEDQGKIGWLKITKVGDEEVEGYCHTDGLEGTDILVLKEEDSDKVVNCCIKVQAGDIIGFTGLNGFEKQEEYRGAHIEVFTPDEVGNFLNNELKDGENNKNFAKLAEGTELKKAFPCKVIKNSRLKLLSQSTNYQKVEVVNIDVTVNDRNAALGQYTSATKAYEFLSEHTDKLSVFNALVGDIAVIGDKVKLVEQLSGSVRKVRHVNPQNGLVCWVKKEDVEKKTITTTTSSSETNQIANTTTTTNNAVTSQPISQSSEAVAVDMSSGNQMNNEQMVPPASSAVNAGVVETPTSAQMSATETLMQQEVSPITTTTNNNTTSAQADSNSQTTSTSEIVDVLNKEITEVYLINPEQEEGIQKLEADTIINIREGKELTDKDNKKWYLISPTGFQKNGMSISYKGLIKESDLGDTFSAYKWSQFGFEVKEDADNKYVYDFENKPAFLSAICEIADTDGNGILEPLELQRAIKNHYTYDKLSHVVAKHINEWAYSGQYLTPLMDEVTEVLDKGIELEDDDDIKKDLETLKKERLDAFEAKVKQLALWESIESKKESYKSIFVNGTLLTNPVTAIPYLEYKACRWIYNKLTSGDEEEQQIPLSPFPITKPVVYHFHPIAFVEQMKRIGKLCIIGRDYFYENYEIEFKSQDDNVKVVTEDLKNDLEIILEGIEKYDTSEGGAFSKEQIAYILATIKHETGYYKPVIESYWCSESVRNKYYEDMYDPVLGKNETRKNMALNNENTLEGDGVKYAGKGYVQITWKKNYRKAKEKFGVDFVGNPELALVPKYSIDIALYGFDSGMFTGKTIHDYINEDKCDYYNARRVINGTDAAESIKNYAMKFEKCLLIK